LGGKTAKKHQNPQSLKMNAKLIQDFYRNLPQLETPRLVLRKATPSDMPAVFAYASNPEVTRYLRWGPHKTQKETENYLNEVLEEYRQGLDGPWLVEHKENQTVIGQIHLMEVDSQHRKAQVGFVLSKSCWNQGMMTEALRKVLVYAFDKIGLNRVEGLCIRENRAAARVMEKAGMKKEADLREYLFQKGTYWDFSLYAILHRESQIEPTATKDTE
jgi:ribosomal-protein-alanine N-acetyltransferase